ncbi:hypothetical protein COCON_G00223030 [Conger conger]|uniref:Uncharacterized protein n=1 Tax=Conger conger TaxID=82655 RepID=A0A9Q1HNJ0_CONCO|nr:hypothetical protein COCON_G00223030 [Conger conger]
MCVQFGDFGTRRGRRVDGEETEFMDKVDTFNHLIPTDQLDEALLPRQGLEREASNEAGTGHGHLEDSLRNMLSDKDPMFGSASAQYHDLDNDNANCQAAVMRRGQGGRLPVGRRGRAWVKAAHSMPEVDRTPGTRGNRGRRGANRAVPGKRARGGWRQGLSLGRGAFSGKNLPWHMNPVVVLRRLTVTVGGYKIELLPGPSQATAEAEGDAAEPPCFPESSASTGEVEFSSEPGVTSQPPRAAVGDSTEQLGPFVNPNEVQQGNGSLPGNEVSTEKIPTEAKANGEMGDVKVPRVGVESLIPEGTELVAGKWPPVWLKRSEVLG